MKYSDETIEAAAKVIDPLAFQPVGSCNPRGYESYSQEALSRAIAARRAHALRVAERVVAAYRDAKVAELEARCAKAETKAAISQITAETEKRLRELAENDSERECLWSSDFDLWESSCGMAWAFPDEGPKENDMTYCPKCRGVLIVEALTEGGEHG